MINLSLEAQTVLSRLRNHMEGNADKDGFVMIYLDNARYGMPAKTFRAYLKVLAEAGLYRVVDGYAWGEVKEKD